MSKNLRVGLPEVNLKNEKKYIPSTSDGTHRPNIVGHGTVGIPDINEKSFGTNTKGSDYHDYGRSDSGLHGNFAQKDASVKYLKERGQRGQTIRNYSAGSLNSKHSTGNIGQTAYNSNPIPEVYKPATSNGEPDANAVVYNVEKKDRDC